MRSSPNTPNRAGCSKELLIDSVNIAREHNRIIFADELYDEILYAGAGHHSSAALAPDLLTITFNGLAKTCLLYTTDAADELDGGDLG